MWTIISRSLPSERQRQPRLVGVSNISDPSRLPPSLSRVFFFFFFSFFLFFVFIFIFSFLFLLRSRPSVCSFEALISFNPIEKVNEDKVQMMQQQQQHRLRQLAMMQQSLYPHPGLLAAPQVFPSTLTLWYSRVCVSFFWFDSVNLQSSSILAASENAWRWSLLFRWLESFGNVGWHQLE